MQNLPLASSSVSLHSGISSDGMLAVGHKVYAIRADGVAEMTGRRGRVVADAKGRGVYELRAKPDSTEMDSLNVSETGI